MRMKTIDDFDFHNKKALVRVDFNVPLDSRYEITDYTRIDAAEKTIRKILDDGGSAILMSHLGRPKSGPEEKFSLKHLVKPIQDRWKIPVHFSNDSIGEGARQCSSDLKAGEILLLENLRFHAEEAEGDVGFAKELSQLGDMYVNDAFGTAHRAHASTTMIARFFTQKMAGYIMRAEIENVGTTPFK